MLDWERLTPHSEDPCSPLDYRTIDCTGSPHEIRRAHIFTFLSNAELDALARKSTAWAGNAREVQAAHELLVKAKGNLPLVFECSVTYDRVTIALNDAIRKLDRVLAPFEDTFA